MKYETKFNIGDDCYFARRDNNRKLKKTCHVCNGAGLFMHNGQEFKCTCLDGYLYTYAQTMKIHKTKIIGIEIKDDPKNQDHVWITYIVISGGGGRMWLKEEELFESRSKCEKYCKEKGDAEYDKAIADGYQEC